MRTTETVTLPLNMTNAAEQIGGSCSAPDPFGPLRRKAPGISLTPVARDWVAGLGPSLNLRHLVSAHPRIVNNLAVLWDTPVRGTQYLASLLQDKRPGRRGFSASVQHELRLLRAYRGYELTQTAKKLSAAFSPPAKNRAGVATGLRAGAARV